MIMTTIFDESIFFFMFILSSPLSPAVTPAGDIILDTCLAWPGWCSAVSHPGSSLVTTHVATCSQSSLSRLSTLGICRLFIGDQICSTLHLQPQTLPSNIAVSLNMRHWSGYSVTQLKLDINH